MILVSLFSLAFAFWLMTSTIAFDANTNTLQMAGKIWSDFSAHIPVIRSFSYGYNWPVEYPIYPGAPIRYHFLFYWLVAMLEKIGIRIDWAINIPSIIGFAALLIVIYGITKTIIKKKWAGWVAMILFLCNGSLSFLKYFETHPLSTQTPMNIYTNTKFPAFAPWDGGIISAFWNLNIYTNQRHLAGAFAIVLGWIWYWAKIREIPWKNQNKWMTLVLGITIGILPYAHQPSLMIMGIFMACYIILYKHLRIHLILGGIIGALIAIPQLIPLFSSESATSFSYHPGYLIETALTMQTIIKYWWQNLGISMILIPLGFILLPNKDKKFMLPLIPLFIIPNCFKFSIEIAANHKFFNFFLIMGNILTIYVLQKILSIKISHLMGDMHWGATKKGSPCGYFWGKMHDRTHQMIYKNVINFAGSIEKFSGFTCSFGGGIYTISKYCLVATIFLFLTLSGIIDLFPIINDPKYELVDMPKNETAQWIEKNTPKDTIFLNSSYMYHPASLAGRKIFLGWPYFPWSAGYKENRMPIMKTMYESDKQIYCPLFQKYHISFISVENVFGNPDLPTINLETYLEKFTPIYLNANKSYAIFTAEELCKEKEK